LQKGENRANERLKFELQLEKRQVVRAAERQANEETLLAMNQTLREVVLDSAHDTVTQYLASKEGKAFIKGT
jgi:hypothetical protein